MDILHGDVGRLWRHVAMEECHLQYLRDVGCTSNSDFYNIQRQKTTNARKMMLDAEDDHHRARLRFNGLKHNVDDYKEWI